MEIMFYVYILLSQKDNGFYIGYSADLKLRYKEHQQGLVKATKTRRPVELIYYEAYKKEKKARQRELKLKQFGSAYYALLKRLGYYSENDKGSPTPP